MREDGGRGQGEGEGGWRKDRKRLRGGGARYEVPSFAYLVRCLNRDNLLPAIVFIFSRNGCDQAAREVAKSTGRPLVSTEESEELLRRLEVGHHDHDKRTLSTLPSSTNASSTTTSTLFTSTTPTSTTPLRRRSKPVLLRAPLSSPRGGFC